MAAVRRRRGDVLPPASSSSEASASSSGASVGQARGSTASDGAPGGSSVGGGVFGEGVGGGELGGRYQSGKGERKSEGETSTSSGSLDLLSQRYVSKVLFYNVSGIYVLNSHTRMSQKSSPW